MHTCYLTILLLVDMINNLADAMYSIYTLDKTHPRGTTPMVAAFAA